MPTPEEQIEDRAVRIPEVSGGNKPATVFAEANINGNITTVRASLEEAEASGWKVLGPIHPGTTITHKSRTAAPPSSPQPAPAGPSGPEADTELELTPSDRAAALRQALDGFTVPELKEQADELGLEGISKLRKSELIDTLVQAHAEELEE